MAELKRYNKRNTKHGICGKYPKLYRVWRTMLHRCEDPKREKYKDYGGRGITVCEEWKDPSKFATWSFANGYADGLQIDRIDNNAGYCPQNCRWVTAKENSRNRRNTVLLSVNGETKSVAEWCETINVSPYTVYWWVKEKGKEYAEQRMSEIA